MVKQWHKYLNKLNIKQQLILKDIIGKLISLDFSNLDIESIKGEQNYYRCRVGNIRIIFENINNKIIIRKIGHRGDVYK